MGFVHFNEKGYLVRPDGTPFYLTGVNYVASYICTNFLDDYRESVLRKDLAKIRDMGLNCVRIPIYWGFFEPEENVFNPVAFKNLEAFLGLCREYDLFVMPWCLVGVATRDADVPYRQGRPFFTGHMLYAAENHLATLARRFRENEQILCWDICDEPEFYSRHPGQTEQLPYDSRDFHHWVKHMRDALKQNDPNHLVTLGYGAIVSENYGYNVIESAKILDMMVVTCYPYDTAIEGLDTMRNNYYLGYYTKMNAHGKPVYACEAPGFTSTMYSEKMLGRYFNVSIYSALINGSVGVMPWVFNDFAEDIWCKGQLDTMSHEPLFGIVDNSGRVKPSGQALVDFARFTREEDIVSYKPARRRVGLFVPNDFYPNIYTEKEKLWVAMAALKGASADFDIVWDQDSLEGYELIVVPSMSSLTGSWKKLEEYVRGGGNVLMFHRRNHTSAYTDRLFGFESQSRKRDFGLGGMRFCEDFGPWKAGETARTIAEKPERGERESYWHVLPGSAKVIAAFPCGDAAVTENAYGKGRAWYVTAPMCSGLYDIPYEQYLEDAVFGIVRGVVERAGIRRPLVSDNHQIECGLLEKEDGAIAVVLNHAPDAQKCTIRFDGAYAGATVRRQDTDETIDPKAPYSFAMEAAQAVCFRLAFA